MPIRFDFGITSKKAAKNAASTSVVAFLVIRTVLANLFEIEVSDKELAGISASVGVVSGIVRGIANWWKNRRRG